MAYKVTITRQGAIFDGRASAIIRSDLVIAMTEAVTFLERQVKAKTPQGVYGAQGGLLASIHGEVVNVGGSVVKGIVGHQSTYGDVVELGRRPGRRWPPQGVLLRWIEKKITQWGGGTAKQRESTAKGLEFVIRRKIGTKGFYTQDGAYTGGAKMFEKALQDNWPQIQAMFDRAGFDIARDLGGKG